MANSYITSLLFLVNNSNKADGYYFYYYLAQYTEKLNDQ